MKVANTRDFTAHKKIDGSYVRNLAGMAVTAGAATSMRIWVFTLHLH